MHCDAVDRHVSDSIKINNALSDELVHDTVADDGKICGDCYSLDEEIADLPSKDCSNLTMRSLVILLCSPAAI